MTLLDHAESLRPDPTHLAHRHAVLAAIGAGPDPADALVALAQAAAAATTARIAFVLVADETAHLRPFGPAIAGHRTIVAIPPVALTMDGADAPQRAISTGDVIIDQGPAREANAWGELCSALAIGVALAAPLRHGTATVGALIVGDPEDLMTARDALAAIAQDAATVVSVARRMSGLGGRTPARSDATVLSSDMIATVSHELRTPLTAIVGSLQTLQRPELAPSDPAARELVAVALAKTDRLRVLVDDLLVIGSLDRGMLPTRVRPVDIGPLVRDTIAMVPGATDHLAIIEPSTPIRCVVDGDHLGRIVRNLVENVLRHAPRSSGEVIVTQRDDVARITVIDHGPGVDPGHIEGLFDRAAPSSTNEGLGIGLAIARGLAEAIDGTIVYSPTDGGGSTFTVSVRLVEP